MKYITFFVGIFFLSPLFAYAHATPLSYEPASGAGLSTPPEQITIRFSERLERAASSIIVVAPDGSRSSKELSFVSPDNPYVLTAPVPRGKDGAYTISWQVISADDGHFTKGAFSFSVGSGAFASSASSLSIDHGSKVLEALVLSIELLGEYVLIALLVLNAVLLRPLARRFGDSFHTISAAMRRGLTGAAILAATSVLGSSLAFLFIKAQELSNLTGDTFDEALSALLETNTGEAAVIRGLLATAIALLFLFFHHRIWEKTVGFFGITTALLIGIIAYYRAVISHATASHFLPDLGVAVNILHLFDKGLIVGSLILMTLVILPILARREEFAIAVRPLFSRVIAIGFLLGGASAAYIAWLHLKDWSNLNSDWGYRFLILLVVSALLVIPRIFQEFFLNPVIKNDMGGRRRDALRFSRLLFSFEACAGAAVAAVSALIIITTPPVYGNPTLLSQTVDGERIELQADVEHADRLVLALPRYGDNSISPAVTLIAANEELGIESLVVELSPESAGRYFFARDTFSTPGVWHLRAVVSRPESYDINANFSFTRDDLVLEHAPRQLNTFAFIFIFSSLFVTLLAALVMRRTELIGPGTLRTIPGINSDMSRYAVLSGMVLFIAVLLVVSMPLPLLKGPFRLQCEAQGHFWNQGVPMRDGRVTSPIARAGCSVGTGRGMSHFVKQVSYEDFLTPAFPSVSLMFKEKPSAGVVTPITVRIVNELGRPQQDLAISHDRLLHMIIVSEDFSSFSHVHPDNDRPLTAEEIADASFSVPYTFPASQRYVVAVDYAVRAQSFSHHETVPVLGERHQPHLPLNQETTQLFDGYEVTLRGASTLRAGNRLNILSYHISRNGTPVTDLESYLAAPMHFAVVSEDLREFVHAHGELPLPLFERFGHTHTTAGAHVHKALPEKFGPHIEAHLTFPKPGAYVIFGEFKHDGQVIVTRFPVRVE